MYRDEVPLYGALLELVAETNARVLDSEPALAHHLQRTGEIQRLDMERHGAIRLGTAAELATISRLFAVMGMQPVGYYDLTPPACPCTPPPFAPYMNTRCKPARFACSPHCCAWN